MVNKQLWCVHLGWMLIWGGKQRILVCAFRLEAHLGRYRKNYAVCIQAGSLFGVVKKELWSVYLGCKLIWGGTERNLTCALRLEVHLVKYRKNFGVCIQARRSFGVVKEEFCSVHLGWKLIWGGTERILLCAFRLEAHLGRYRKKFGVCIQAGSSFGEVQKELWCVHLGWKLIWGGKERILECAFRLEANLGW